MKQPFKSFCLAILLVSSGTIGLSSTAFASGIGLSEQSVRGLGNAFSGGAASAEDASTIFFNPAGLTRLSGKSFQNAVYVIAPTANFDNQGSATFTGAPLLGGEGGDGGVNILMGNYYAAWSLSDDVKIGLGIGVPFGLATHYDNGWVGRYQAIESRLTTININPTIAARLSKTLSVGAGINLQYADVLLSNAIDFGLIGRSVGLPLRPQSADGTVEIQGDDWSWGYNLGVLYEPSKTTRIGLAYRSAITHKIEGEADFNVPAAAAALTRTGQFTDTGASAPLKLPDTLSLSAYHQINRQWGVMGDITWTNWSRFKELRIDFENPAQLDRVQPENWKDTVRLGVGVNYAMNDQLTLRTGIAYDPSPVKDEFRTARVPDNDRVWLAVGASYQASPSLSIDIGYAHLFVDKAPINQSSLIEGTLKGTYNNNVDVIGVQVNWKF
ncbi:MAG: outer membrane protein transport protein [Scytolyngbya sp. HA4215-MV1]|jgi:long-chain fatty acid transport protein|nr:outer membrane protein transport protein [Scytolyngbya sp. HA4215-MV1]